MPEQVPVPEAVTRLKAGRMPQKVKDAVQAHANATHNISTMQRLLDAGEMDADARRAVGECIAKNLGVQAAARKRLARVPSRKPLVGGDER